MTTHIFKILRRDEWLAFENTGVFDGSVDDVRDGFIHLSSAEQVPGTLERHFSSNDGAGESSLQILSFDVTALSSGLQWELSRGGALFPHYYGSLLFAQVVRAVPLDLDQAGKAILPADFPSGLSNV